MTFYRQFPPILHDFIYKLLCSPRLQPQGIPGKVNYLFAFYLGKMELLAIFAKWVNSIELSGKRQRIFEGYICYAQIES